MRRFNFRLDSLLNLRERIEELLKSEFSNIQAQLKKEEMRLESLVNLYREKIEGLIEKGELTPSEIEINKSYLFNLKEDMEESKRMLELLRRRSEDKKDELLAARKDKKVLEVIKDKLFKEYLKGDAKEEQALIDEFNSNKAKKEAL